MFDTVKANGSSWYFVGYFTLDAATKSTSKQNHHFPHFDKFEENIFHISVVANYCSGFTKK